MPVFIICILQFFPLLCQDKLVKAAHSGVRYGVLYKGKLIPEVVKRGNLEIGRFEVTRAQYVAWDTGYPVPHGTENYPANGITLPQAQGYCEWLTKLTGRVFRVPTEEETADLYKASTGDKSRAAKLMEVGRSKPNQAVGQEAIYDLDGNVTEWVLTQDGTGKTAGGSAGAKDDPMFTGFRVVRGIAKK